MSQFENVNQQELESVQGGFMVACAIIVGSAAAIAGLSFGNAAGGQGSITDAALAGMHKAKHG